MRNDRRVTTIRQVLFSIVTLCPVMGVAVAQVPDLTRGGRIPDRWAHDWTLGPTGMRGWIYSDKLVTTDARQIQITEIERVSGLSPDFSGTLGALVAVSCRTPRHPTANSTMATDVSPCFGLRVQTRP